MRKLIVTLCLCGFSINLLADHLYYIYKDARGRTHISDSVTHNHAKYGYRVVNSAGATLRVVPSTTERMNREKRRIEREAEIKARNKKNHADEYLLQSFVDEEDIRQAGNKKILTIQKQIDITNDHIKAFEENLKQLKAQVAQADREGRDITEKDVEGIRLIKESIVKNKEFVVNKIQEQKDIRIEYMGYIERFKALKKAK